MAYLFLMSFKKTTMNKQFVSFVFSKWDSIQTDIYYDYYGYSLKIN